MIWIDLNEERAALNRLAALELIDSQIDASEEKTVERGFHAVFVDGVFDVGEFTACMAEELGVDATGAVEDVVA